MKLSSAALNALLTAALIGTSLGAMAHGDEGHSKKAVGPARKEQKEWGIAGDARAVNRTIQIAMTDNMRFTPDRIDVKQGDVVRFVIRNNGKMLHEMVIGTKQVLDEHAALMVKFPTMEHEEPYMAHVPQGKSAEMIWNFNRPGEFDFACLIAGHYQAGMVGKIKVAATGMSNGHTTRTH
ncbi:MAG TPA: cupredoxin family protein [Burkholderiaceae bacterium]|nr:cupredoxin family protein [Burkholderiaceae bacterium]